MIVTRFIHLPYSHHHELIPLKFVFEKLSLTSMLASLTIHSSVKNDQSHMGLPHGCQG